MAARKTPAATSNTVLTKFDNSNTSKRATVSIELKLIVTDEPYGGFGGHLRECISDALLDYGYVEDGQVSVTTV